MQRSGASFLVLVGAVLLVASLWLTWVAAPQMLCDPAACPPGTEPGDLNAWEAFSVADVALAVLATASAFVALTLAGVTLAEYGCAVLGWLAAAGSIYAVDHPAAAIAGVPSRSGIGFFVALAASGCIVVGGIAAAHRSPGAGPA